MNSYPSNTGDPETDKDRGKRHKVPLLIMLVFCLLGASIGALAGSVLLGAAIGSLMGLYTVILRLLK